VLNSIAQRSKDLLPQQQLMLQVRCCVSLAGSSSSRVM
jgi:hypothetical protein